MGGADANLSRDDVVRSFRKIEEQIVDSRHQARGEPIQGLAGRSPGNVLPGPIEEHGSELLFQFAYAVRYCGLGDSEMFARSCDALQMGGLVERPELLEAILFVGQALARCDPVQHSS